MNTRDLVQRAQSGEIALPYMQRPFVWTDKKVAELFDSMHHGYPVGEIMLWETPSQYEKQYSLASNKNGNTSRYLIVDGQQRITGLYSALTGYEVLGQNHRMRRIKIAFNPFMQTYAVSTRLHTHSPEWVDDVAFMLDDENDFIGEFTDDCLARGIPKEDVRSVRKALVRASAIAGYSFKVVNLYSRTSEVQVMEIFERINSKAVKLGSSDLLMTAMAVFWPEVHAMAREFSRSAKTLPPETGEGTAYNYIWQPSPNDMVRVAVAVALKRGDLKGVADILRTADSSKQSAEALRQLKVAMTAATNLTNWRDFLRCIERAGYRSRKFIDGRNSILAAYSLWLVGLIQYKVDRGDLKDLIARWFYMATLARRYEKASEGQLRSDLEPLERGSSEVASQFFETLEGHITNTLTSAYWESVLPENLDSAGINGPLANAYIAAQSILDGKALLSDTLVRTWTDPMCKTNKDFDRHHLFPKAYLRKELSITDSKRVNHLANLALIEWYENNKISAKGPSKYWPQVLEERGFMGADKVLDEHRYWHALPSDWTDMEYEDFLAARRPLIARVIQDAYQRLCDPSYSPSFSTPIQPIATATTTAEERREGTTSARGETAWNDFLRRSGIGEGEILVGTHKGEETLCEIVSDGRILLAGRLFASPSGAAKYVAGHQRNGWEFWSVETKRGRKSLASLRDALTD